MPAIVDPSYEEVPYEGFALFLTSPDHLAALARLFEVSAPEVETCRVLELGCARGDNLIPMALAMPRARFVGVDLSPGQIAAGRAAIAELGLENIDLIEQSIVEVRPDLGPFDFIVAHGVYSWVPDPVQEKMLSLCAEALAPNGLAYVSFNTYPGWHMRTMIRDMMVYQARAIGGTRDRVRAGRSLMKGLVQVLAQHENPYARCLREEAQAIVRHDESYLAHEYLEATNDPIYFHQFVERAAAHGLRYLAEAQYWTMAATQPPELFQSLGDSSLDWLGREQLYDFIKGRAFHNAVLCREGPPCSRTPSARAMMSLRFTALVRPAGENAAPRPEGGEDFHNFRGEFALSTNDPVIRAALRILDEARPRSVPFGTLWARVQERLAASGAGATAVPGGEDPATAAGSSPTTAAMPERLAEALPGLFGHNVMRLAETLLGLFAHNIIEVHVREPGFTTEVGEFPRASPVARRQAAGAARVANLRHRMVGLVDFDQVVLAHLDGRHDRRALVAKMQGAIAAGSLNVQAQGRPITDPAEAEPILARLLEESLRRLAAGALLVG
jgi:SAM-dependent methyltransferase